MHTVLKEEGHPIALRKTLLAMIEGSIGSEQYLKLYIAIREASGVSHTDVIGNGRFACAYYTSALLHLTNLLEGRVHTTVSETVTDLEASGWYPIPEPISGSVIIWGPKLASDGQPHRHIGFSLGDEVAVSTDGTTGRPTKHHLTFGETEGRPARPIEAIYFHEQLHW